MTFEDVLTNIANAYGLDSYDLIGYSYEDEISGWDQGYGDWPVGSLWTVEGRILYALIRALQPNMVVEIGTNVGCSASHIASALKMNGTGKLMTFDTAGSVVIPPDKDGHSAVYKPGQLIPDDLRPFVEVVNADGIKYLREYIGEVDFIFEDGAHSFEGTRDAWVSGLAVLNPGGLLISHDAAHFLVGETIRKGIAAAGVVPNIYEVQPSDCGLAIYRQPQNAEKPVLVDVVSKEIPLSAFVPTTATVLEPAFDDMTTDELRDYAYIHNIDLGNTRSKSKIIKLLRGA